MTNTRITARARWAAWLYRSLGLAMLLSACGGGVGTGGTGSYAYGPITGFGSIIVNGVRYDDASARVEDDSGTGRSREALKLGMTVSIESGEVSGGTATATAVRFGSLLAGPVTAVDTAGNSMQVLGQTVQLRSTTVWDDSLGTLAALTVGRVVEVHGFVDAANQSVVATRVEPAAGALALFKVSGVVASLNAVSRSFALGQANFSYGGAANVPAGLANGQIVTARVRTVAEGGQWVVASFGGGLSSRPLDSRNRCDVRGLITSLASTADFVLNDVRVNAGAALFPDGTAGIVVGARVKVEGSCANDRLTATKVEIENEERLTTEGIDLRGAIESVDTATSTFRVRGSVVFYGLPTVRFDGGTVADLAVGRQVRVRGVLSPERDRVLAVRIEL